MRPARCRHCTLSHSDRRSAGVISNKLPLNQPSLNRPRCRRVLFRFLPPHRPSLLICLLPAEMNQYLFLPLLRPSSSCHFLSQQEDVMRGCERCGQVPGELALQRQRGEGWRRDNGLPPGEVCLLVSTRNDTSRCAATPSGRRGPILNSTMENK